MVLGKELLRNFISGKRKCTKGNYTWWAEIAGQSGDLTSTNGSSSST